MKNNYFKIFTIVLIFSLFACSTYKANLLGGNLKENAIKNAILDYSKIKRSMNRYKTFRVVVDSSCNFKKPENYCIKISPMINIYSLTPYDTIGIKSSNLYNDFVVKDGNLFLWVDYTKGTNQKTLDIMDSFKILDSSFIKKGYSDVVFSTIGHPRDTRFYIFCKKDIKKYKIVKGSYITKNNYPLLDCGNGSE